jgi:phytanoyl-CoA hydroxylase
MSIYQFDLSHDGLLVVRNALPQGVISHFKKLSTELISGIPQEKRKRVLSLGSIGEVERKQALLSYIFTSGLLDAVDKALQDYVQFQYAVVFSKPPQSPPTFWHQDFVWWNDPIALEPKARHLQSLLYLDDTSEENGCLRVVPQSHRKKHKLHDFWQCKDLEESNQKTNHLRAYEDKSSLAYADLPDQVAIPVTKGDLILIDTRVFHGAYTNSSHCERSLLTCSLLRNVDDFTGQSQALIARSSKRFFEALPSQLQAQFSSRAIKTDSAALPGEKNLCPKPLKT